jgi:hypothetical protein
MHGKLPTNENLKVRGCSIYPLSVTCALIRKSLLLTSFLNALMLPTFGIGSQRLLALIYISMVLKTFGCFVMEIGSLNAKYSF